MKWYKLVSFDLKADFGFFKKPDVNEVYLTYNMLHKPALLGILGAIVGLQGFQKNAVLPLYYQKLKHLKIGVTPLSSRNGNFDKHFIKYINTTGMANDDGNLIVREQVLINPEYRCFLLLNLEDELENNLYCHLQSYCAEFLPYMGKNDFSAWWENFREYDSFERFSFDRNYRIATIFCKEQAVIDYLVKMMGFAAMGKEPVSLYFEKLPAYYDEILFQYRYEDFVYSQKAQFRKDMKISMGDFYTIDEEQVIQLI